MKKIYCILLVLLAALNSSAQKQSYDLATYVAPAGFTMQAGEKSLQYSLEDKAKGSYCLITLFKGLPSTGQSKPDFDAAWESLVKETLTISAEPVMQDSASENGWVAQSGYSTFESEGNKGIVILVTMSGFQKLVPVLILTNTDEYQPAISSFLESIDLAKPVAEKVNPGKPEKEVPVHPNTSPVKSGFAFTRTEFDDGWVSTVQEDWVEVRKGDVKILLHYPNPEIKPANTDVNVMCAAAWNVLVAPRYSNIQNYKLTPGMLDYERPYYAEANLTDNATGQQVFVALFRKGNTSWIEFVCPDRNTFIQQFGLDVSAIDYYADSNIWAKLVRMNNYNKFAVAATDFKGKWSDRFASNTYYTNIYTGMSAGMSTYTSSQSFEFGAGQSYKWHLVMANSYGGNMQYSQGKGAGKFTVLNNWQVRFSEMEGKPKTYDAYFTAIKGGRVLWMNDAQNPGSGIFTGFSKAD
ncbi:MAG: hypothetical protein HYZ15_08445 [Sphingobacteriales bacterium]|nr:hypothetical protein [Sphingobacteriales bacterium]